MNFFEQNRQQGGHDVAHQGAGDRAERAADDHADGHVHHVALGDEGFEFFKELFHGDTSFLIIYYFGLLIWIVWSLEFKLLTPNCSHAFGMRTFVPPM